MITTRTRIEVRWTNSPAALGYANTVAQREAAIAAHVSSSPDFVGTPRQVQGYLAELLRKQGGVFYRVDLRTVAGEKIDVLDIRECLAYAEYRRRR